MVKDRDARFLRRDRLVRGDQFERVYRRRRSVADGRLIVYGCENDVGSTRVGLSVSRKVGGLSFAIGGNGASVRRIASRVTVCRLESTWF